jgi:putative transcriptional regulator
MDESLAGKILLAMPNMGDPRFHRAAILICAHDDNGAMGLVINHPLPGLSFATMLSQLNIPADENKKFSLPDIPVLGGGPVENARGFIVHSRDFQLSDTIIITDDLAVTGTVDALRDVAAGRGPEHMIFVLGYSGWTAGQLEQEIQENVWLVADANMELIFSTEIDEKWTSGIKTLGVNLAMLSGEAGRA